MSANTYSHPTFALYLGPHSPVSLPLQKVLVKNQDALQKTGSEFPKPQHHREVLRNSLLKCDHLTDVQTVFHDYLNQILKLENSKHIIFNYDAFLGSRKSALSISNPYPSLEVKLEPLNRFLTGHAFVVFLCLQPYHLFVDNELENFPAECEEIVHQYDKFGFSWIPFVNRIRRSLPAAHVIILEEEELCKTWPLTVELVSGSSNALSMVGINDFPVSCLHAKGRRAYRKEIARVDPSNVTAWVQTTNRYFEQFGREVPVMKRIFPSFWSREQSERSQLQFDSDLTVLGQSQNVTIAADLFSEFA